MDVRVEEGASQLASETLTYSWLYRQVQIWGAQSIYRKPSRLERWSGWIGLLAAAVGLVFSALPSSLVSPANAVLAALICLLIEVVGIGLSFALMAGREWQQYVRPRLSHAQEMDGEFDHWRTLVGAIRQFPREQREDRLRFVTSLRQGMSERMGLMYGSLQKLGPFPLLIALYLQFRDWRWGDWTGAFDVGFFGGLLIAGMVVLYGLGWILLGIRTRLDTYVNLLEAALVERRAADGEPESRTEGLFGRVL